MTTRHQALATAAAVGLVYTIAVAWLVGSEGRSYRESLRERRGQSTDLIALAPSATSVALAPTSASRVPPNAVPVAPIPAPPPPGVPAPASSPARNKPATNGLPPTTSERTITDVAVKSPSPATATGEMKSLPFVPKPPSERSPGAVWADTLDLASITVEQEKRLGVELNQLVLAGNAVDPEGDVQRLRKAAAPLLQGLSRPEINYTFAILDSEEVNAFSLPGGFIYVSKGLFRMAGEEVDPEEDYVLQFALGHEIAHVDLKHTLKVVAPGNAAAKKQGVDTLSQCMLPIGLGYPDTMEFAADAWTYDRMTRQARRSRREALMFLVKLKGFSEKYGFRNGRQVPDPNSGRSLVENHYRAHPAAWDRLDRIKEPTASATAVPPPSR